MKLIQENSIYQLSQIEDGIFHVLFKEGRVLTEEHAVELYQLYENNCSGNYGAILEFQSAGIEPTLKAKKLTAQSNSIPDRFKARAIINNSLGVRIVANNFVTRFNPKTPTLLVKNLKEGIAFVKKNL